MGTIAIAVTATVAALTLGSPARSVEPGTDALPVGTCINIGNTFEPPHEAEWGGQPLEDADLRRIAAAGFATIRLPVRWDTHAGDSPPYPIDPGYMARIHHFVDLAMTLKLKVVLNSHHFGAIDSDPGANATRLAAYWKQIGEAFAAAPRDQLWFELSNEPHDKFDRTNLLTTLAPSLAAVRASNPDRPVIIGGENWSSIDSLATLELPDDPNVVPTFHYYEPFDFTHQGASWVEPSPPVGRVYGTDADKARLVADVEKVRAYIKRTGKTPFMGETGAHITAPLDQLVAYTRAVHDAFAPLGIGICPWGYANTFPFYDHDKREWLPGMRAALGLKE